MEIVLGLLWNMALRAGMASDKCARDVKNMPGIWSLRGQKVASIEPFKGYILTIFSVSRMGKSFYYQGVFAIEKGEKREIIFGINL